MAGSRERRGAGTGAGPDGAGPGRGTGDRPRLAWLPDALTRARLYAVPLLWVLALLRLPVPLGIGAAAAAFTDVLDGVAARRLGIASRRGGALDSAADLLLSGSLLAWIVLLRPEFVREEAVPLLAWAAFAAIVLVAGWVRFRQVGNLHLLSAKVAGFSAYAFGILLLVTGGYDRRVLAAVLALLWIASAETLLVIVLRRDVRDHRGSIFLRK
jgi:phosphatidylglycerophosphate synthase